MKTRTNKNECSESTAQYSSNSKVNLEDQSEITYTTVKKPITKQSYEGWKFQWMTPKNCNNHVISVIPGPFLRPKLVKALPYIVDNVDNNTLGKLRNGIPDPWLEYLAWHNIENKHKEMMDAGISREYLRFTDYIWNKKCLAMVQGIPDPWKFDIHYLYNVEIDYKHKKEKTELNLKKQSIILKKKDMINIQKNVPKLGEIKNVVEEVNNKSKKKLNNQDGFDKVKQKLLEIENQLKDKNTENNFKAQEIEKYVKSKLKDLKNKNKNQLRNRSTHLQRNVCCKKLFKKCPQTTSKESTKKIKEVLKNVKYQTNGLTCIKDEINIPHKQKDLNSKISKCSLPLSETSSNRYSEKSVFKKVNKQIKVTTKESNCNDFVIDINKDFNDESLQDDCFIRNIKNLGSVSQLDNNYTAKKNNIKECNLFFKRNDKDIEKMNIINLKKESKYYFENNQEPTNRLHTADYNIIEVNNSVCPNHCQKKNCAKYCFNTTQKKNELFVETFSEKDEY